MSRTLQFSSILLGSLFSIGCYQAVAIEDPDGSPLPEWDGGERSSLDAAIADSGIADAGIADAAFVEPPGKCTAASAVDLLFVIDNSASMAEEQSSLVAQLPRLVQTLIEPPDRDSDGMPDWVPIEDLQVAVVTTDMGASGFFVPTCERGDFGDDGRLTLPSPDLVGCSPSLDPILRFGPSGLQSVTEFARDVGCVARAGVEGCGFEQHLEATLKALSPSAPTPYTGPAYQSPRFFRSTLGHGDGANLGFIRDDSLLAIVVLTDEDDCSVSDPNLFDPNSPRYEATNLNLRCHAHPQALNPVSRYVEGLQALRQGRPDLLAFALIAGIPLDLTTAPGEQPRFDEILNDSRMTERVDPEMETRLLPSCSILPRVEAMPPRRLVEMARGLSGARTTIQSICQEDFSPVADAISALVGRRACAERDLD